MNALRELLNLSSEALAFLGRPAPDLGRSGRGSLPSTVPVLGVVRPLRIHRKVQARRYILRVDEHLVVHLTIPPRGSHRQALDFLAEQRSWMDAQAHAILQKQEKSRWRAGTTVLLDGVWQTLSVVPRRRGAGVKVTLGPWSFITIDPDQDLRPHLERRIKSLARRTLPVLVHRHARKLGCTVAAVSIRSQRTRWGSCSCSGRVSLNWKLVQFPRWVRDYIVLHELAHLEHLDHSDQFWNRLRGHFPAVDEAEVWLKLHARELARPPTEGEGP